VSPRLGDGESPFVKFSKSSGELRRRVFDNVVLPRRVHRGIVDWNKGSCGRGTQWSFFGFSARCARFGRPAIRGFDAFYPATIVIRKSSLSPSVSVDVKLLPCEGEYASYFSSSIRTRSRRCCFLAG
jgi:hypothetical protein